MGVNASLSPPGTSKPSRRRALASLPLRWPSPHCLLILCVYPGPAAGQVPCVDRGDTTKSEGTRVLWGGGCSESRAGAQPSCSGHYGSSGGSSSLAWAHVHAGPQDTPHTASTGNLVTKASQLTPAPPPQPTSRRPLPTMHMAPPTARSCRRNSTGPRPGPSATSLRLAEMFCFVFLQK